MRKILLSLSILAAFPLLETTARAHTCCYGYRVRHYRVHPNYQVLRPVRTPPRWSIGVHAVGQSTDQMFGGEGVFLGGMGGHMRLRGYRWGAEIALDGVGGNYLDGQIKRFSVPFSTSAMLYLIPEGRFNLYLIGGIRVAATHMEVDLPNLYGEQDFVQFGFHGGAGAEILLGRSFALTGDVRFIGMILDDNSADGIYYQGVDQGLIPSESTGLQFNLGVSFRF